MKFILVPLLVLSALLPVFGQESTAIPFAELGAKATADYKGDAIGITPTPEGATLRTGFQKLTGTVTSDGLRLASTDVAGGSLQLKASAMGRVDAELQRLPEQGDVASTRSLVSFTRPWLTEEYSVSADGVRQDFIVSLAPSGNGLLSVELALSGASAEAAAEGAKLTLGESGRTLAYSRLKVTDANGSALEAKLSVLSPTRLAVRVQDEGAVYPIRIDPTFSDANWVSLNPGLPGANGSVRAAVVDGNGNLYIGGDFTHVGTVAARGIAKWDGSTWSALGSGVDGSAWAFVVSGGDLYVGGSFTLAGGASANNIAKWDGSAWSALGSGMDGVVDGLAVSGSDLYAGGWFKNAGGIAANHIAKWNGSLWTSLGTGVNDTVLALAVIGSDLYAGGNIRTAGGLTPRDGVFGIAKWNGSAWSALGTGVGGSVSALAVNGTDLYVGGNFVSAGSVAANNIAKWNGSTWSTLGTGTYSTVRALAVQGGDLYAGGDITSAGGVTIKGIAKWNGSAWSAVGSQIDYGGGVYALAGNSTDLYVGGEFTKAGNKAALHIAKLDAGAWSALGSGFDAGVGALVVQGTDLYAGGAFITTGSVQANRVAKWDGTTWSALGTGMNDYVTKLAVNGSDLYAAGYFSTADGATANHVAKWNGSAWSALGAGTDSLIDALVVSGNDVYVGGYFTTAGGIAARNVAKWDGNAWSALGSGVSDSVYALAVTGSDLYAAGYFNGAGGLAANNIAKWNGSAWSALGAGTDGHIRAVVAKGSDLYVGGRFSRAGGVEANCIAKWDGNAWTALGSGLDGTVLTLAVVGPDLYAGGDFTTADGKVARGIAKWNGKEWWVGTGLDNNDVSALAADANNHLYVGGWFTSAGSVISPFVVQANLLPPPTFTVKGNNLNILNDEPLPDASSGTDFGAVPLLNNQVTHRFTIDNQATIPLNLTGTPKVQITGAAAGDFKVTASPSASVGVGGSTTFDITFDPSLPGLRTATVSIANDSDTTVFTFAISGFGKLAALRPQTITFNPPATHYTYPYNITLTATASSGLPVKISLISGPATLFDNTVSITGTGTVKLIASQPGGNNYAAALNVARSILVQTEPTGTTLSNLTQVYSGNPMPIFAYGSNPVVTYKIGATYGSSAPTNAGSYPVKVVDFDVTKTGTLVISKAVLTVIPDDHRRFVGEANPALTYKVTGYLGNDTPAVITKAPVLTTTATTASAGGLYPITASGATAQNYTFHYLPGTMVVESFTGSYEALLVDGLNSPVGKLSITVPTTGKTFTAKLVCPAVTSAVSFAGTLAIANEQATGTDTKNVLINKVSTPFLINFTLPLVGNFSASATIGGTGLGSAIDGQKISAAPVLYAGAHTAVLEPATPASSNVPVGAGWATASISSTGVLTLAGRLGDDTAFTSTLSPDGQSSPGYRLFAQPYVAARTQSFLAGEFQLLPHPSLPNHRYLAASTLTWSKTGLATDITNRAGFGPVSTVLKLDPWLPPAAATKTAAAISLAQRLGLTGTTFNVSHSATGSASNANLPTVLNLSPTNVVSVLTPSANPTKWRALTFVPTTGTFTGSFELVDVTKRTPTFSGVLRQPSTPGDRVIGEGHYLLPPSAGTEKSTGEIRFTK